MGGGAGGSRYVVNQLPRSELSPANRAFLAQSLKDALEEVLLCGRRGEDLHGSSVYLGTSGVALTLFHCATALHAAPPGSLLHQGLAPHTPASLLQAAQRLCEDALRSPPHRTRVTFLEGIAGPLALLVVLLHAQGRPAADWRRHLAALLELHTTQVAQLPPGECEVLYGRAGYLWALLWVRQHLPPGSIPAHILQELVGAIVEQGIQGAQQCGWPAGGLMYKWHDSPYLGAAHGLSGILFVLCHALAALDSCPADPPAGPADGSRPPEPLLSAQPVAATPDLCAGVQSDLGGTVGPSHSKSVSASQSVSASALQGGAVPPAWEGHVQASVDALLAVCLPSGNLPSSLGNTQDRLVQWCHGAPGLAFLLPVACQLWPHRAADWLPAARASADVIWERGLLLKGVGLCHGMAGSSYALLAISQMQQLPLQQEACEADQLGSSSVPLASSCRVSAQNMALFAAAHWRQMYETPDRPASLYEGLSGLVCLLSDVVAMDPHDQAALGTGAGPPSHQPCMPGYQLPLRLVGPGAL